jgi:hypothetical protein
MEEIIMIKKQQKWIALLVVCTFMWLMQVSTMPVAAAGTTEQISSASTEQGPDYYEAVSQKAAPAKKKSMLPMLLIGLGLVTVTAAVLILVVFKDKYDPVGSWTGTGTKSTGGSWTSHMIFSGEKKSGTLTYSDPGMTNAPGTYTKDKKDISFRVNWGGWVFVFTGTFSTKDNMSGTWTTEGLASNNGTWTMTRDGSSAQYPVIQNLGGGIGIVPNK